MESFWMQGWISTCNDLTFNHDTLTFHSSFWTLTELSNNLEYLKMCYRCSQPTVCNSIIVSETLSYCGSSHSTHSHLYTCVSLPLSSSVCIFFLYLHILSTIPVAKKSILNKNNQSYLTNFNLFISLTWTHFTFSSNSSQPKAIGHSVWQTGSLTLKLKAVGGMISTVNLITEYWE